MKVTEIFKTLEEENYFIEHSVRNHDGENIIIGHISDVENPSGLGRREFAFVNKEDKEAFTKYYSEYLSKNI